MTNIRRFFRENDITALTHITYKRAPILIDHFDMLKNSIDITLAKTSCTLHAWVVLPDHLHMIIEIANTDISRLMRSMKLRFSMLYRKRVGMRSGRIWQYRFWDHIMRDEDDYRKQMDYIHYNPVKHGLAVRPLDWEYSSFRDYHREGYYADDWGIREAINFEGEFGE